MSLNRICTILIFITKYFYTLCTPEKICLLLYEINFDDKTCYKGIIYKLHLWVVLNPRGCQSCLCIPYTLSSQLVGYVISLV